MKKQFISTSRLAQICGVSQGTVDRALNDRKGIKKETKEKILRVAKEYGYRQNVHARSMSGGKSSLIGIVVFDPDNIFFSELVSAAEQLLSESGYYTIVTLTHKDPAREISCIENLYYMSVDGIILCPIGKGEDYESFLHSLDIPIIAVCNKLDSFPYVGIDNRKAMSDATNFVIEQGYEHLTYVMPSVSGDAKSTNFFAQDERFEGFRETCDKRKINYDVKKGDSDVTFSKTSQKKAIICSSDTYAISLFLTAKENGYGIIGFDNLNIIERTKMKLDSISQNTSAIAKAATDYLLFSKEPDEDIKYSIIKRGSV